MVRASYMMFIKELEELSRQLLELLDVGKNNHLKHCVGAMMPFQEKANQMTKLLLIIEVLIRLM